MAPDTHNTIDHAADTARDAIDKTSNAANGNTDDLGRIVTDTVDKARILINDGLDTLRTAYRENPARVLTIGAVSLAGLAAVLTTLARRD